MNSNPPAPAPLAGYATGGNRGFGWQFTQLMEKSKVDPGVKLTRAEREAVRKVSSKGFHSLRHNFVSALTNAGVMKVLRIELTGHDDEYSHRIYMHHDSDRLRLELGKIPDF